MLNRFHFFFYLFYFFTKHFCGRVVIANDTNTSTIRVGDDENIHT